jgi:AcrR family transcriptional regulator
MLAKKALPGNKKAITRDKDAKISAITGAARKLIETMGYQKVTIRDIAEEADVSVGLIYKYFPGGKFDILVKGLGYETIDGLMGRVQSENIGHDDFPGYVRVFIKNMVAVIDNNKPFMKAMVVASFVDGAVADEVKKVDIKDFTAIAENFCAFEGVNLDGKSPLETLLYWSIAVKGVLVFNLIYPLPVGKEALTDMLVDLSLKIWGYQAPVGK